MQFVGIDKKQFPRFGDILLLSAQNAGVALSKIEKFNLFMPGIWKFLPGADGEKPAIRIESDGKCRIFKGNVLIILFHKNPSFIDRIPHPKEKCKLFPNKCKKIHNSHREYSAIMKKKEARYVRELIVGVDGGGTKTNFVALDAQTGQKIVSSSAGSINVYFAGTQTALSNLEAGILGLALKDSDKVLAIGIGDPALDDSCEEAGELLREKAAELLPGSLCLSKSDVCMALYAFTGGMPGALVVSGTGSMGIGLPNAYRHGEKNPFLTVGGWGEPATDPGSGYDIAVKGITAAQMAFDGIAPETALQGSALDFFGCKAPRDLVEVLNGEDMTRARIAAFARQVAGCAEAGDPVSLKILDSAGEVLGKYACSLLRQMETNAPVGAYGSVLVNNSHVRKVFTETVQKEYPLAKVQIPKLPPEYGAARFAAHALGICWEEIV